MDVYYGRIHEEFSSCSHTYSKDCSKSLQKLMKTYHFLGHQPKFEVKFPPDGLKPPPKYPNSIQKGSVPKDLEDAFADNEASNTFIMAPSRKE